MKTTREERRRQIDELLRGGTFLMNVRKARERLGLTLKDLAEIAGVSISTLSKIENKKKVTPEILAKVINTLIELEHYEIGL